MRLSRQIILVGLTTFLLYGVALANTRVIEVVKLQHTRSGNILPLRDPFVVAEGSTSDMREQLITKTTLANLIEIKRVIRAFDRAPRSLRISVKQDVSRISGIQENALSGRLRSDNASGRLPDPGGHRGASVELRNSDRNAIHYRDLSIESTIDQRNTQFVTALEGRAALIQTGQSIPIPYQPRASERYGSWVQQGIDYRDVESGIYVTARTTGRQVALDVAPQLRRANHSDRGVIETRSSSATVSGRLGEWIALAGANEGTNDGHSTLLARTCRHNAEIYGVWVKVDALP